MRELWLKVAHTSGVRIYSIVINFVMLVLTARWLGPEGRGQIAAATTWSALFFTISYFSLGQVVIHQVTIATDLRWLAPTFVSLSVLTVLLTVAVWLVAGGLYLVTQGAMFQTDSVLLILSFLMVPFLIWENYASSLLIALNRLELYNYSQVIAKSLSLILLITVLALGGGTAAVLGVMVVGQVILASAGLPELWSLVNSHLTWPTLAILRTLMWGGIKLHANAVGTFLIFSTDVLVINYFWGENETGQYQLALQLINVLLIIPQAASTVMFSYVARLGSNGAWPYHRRALLGVLAMMLAVTVIAFWMGPWLVVWVVGEEFGPALDAFRWLLLALIGMTFSTVMAAQWIGRGLFWQSSMLTLLFGVMNIILSFIWVPQYGMYGSIWGTLITYGMSVIFNGGMAVWCEVQSRQSAQSALPPLFSLWGK